MLRDDRLIAPALFPRSFVAPTTDVGVNQGYMNAATWTNGVPSMEVTCARLAGTFGPWRDVSRTLPVGTLVTVMCEVSGSIPLNFQICIEKSGSDGVSRTYSNVTKIRPTPTVVRFVYAVENASVILRPTFYAVPANVGDTFTLARMGVFVGAIDPAFWHLPPE